MDPYQPMQSEAQSQDLQDQRDQQDQPYDQNLQQPASNHMVTNYPPSNGNQRTPHPNTPKKKRKKKTAHNMPGYAELVEAGFPEEFARDWEQRNAELEGKGRPRE